MADLELIELYPSPFSERVRWVLELKGLPYRRTQFVPLAGEAEHMSRTGIATAPVLLADGEVVGDSNEALDWVEARHPATPLLPEDPVARAQVRAWEHLATEVITPLARLGFIGKAKALGLQPLGDHFAAKYHWSEAEEARGDRILRTVLPELARAVEKTPYLVGNALTRADVTMASMLIPVIGAPSNDLFVLDDPMRAMFGIPMGQESALQPLHRWRDETYRRHRGGQVTPAAA